MKTLSDPHWDFIRLLVHNDESIAETGEIPLRNDDSGEARQQSPNNGKSGEITAMMKEL